jgi:hypothetical protein
MTGTPASPNVVALTACLVLWSALMTRSVQAQNTALDTYATAGALHFDLPAQPLSQVLQVLGHMTDLAVVAPSPLLDGRTSAPINGDYPPREALQRVLAGTGLEANFTGVDEAIIAPLPATQSPSRSENALTNDALAIDGVMSDDRYRSYAAMVQNRLTEALCASPDTRPGSYRLVAQLRIDDAGAVVASDVVASTGWSARDDAIERTMRTLVLDSAPPAGLPEPVTILLRPVSGGVHINCPQPDGQG